MKLFIRLTEIISSLACSSTSTEIDGLAELLKKLTTLEATILAQRQERELLLDQQEKVKESVKQLLEKRGVRFAAQQPELNKLAAVSLVQENKTNALQQATLNSEVADRLDGFLLSEQDIAAIPTYIRQRLTVTECNEVLTTIDKLLIEKAKLFKRSYIKLAIHERLKPTNGGKWNAPNWKGQAYVTEKQLRASLTGKGKLALKTAIPSLRHLGRIKQLRENGNEYYVKLW
ncbi:unnamed protein product, partial [Mesorhabditis belari]|uniref:SKA complex subunit 1 n=1 Tax=Mesorhabditis belari TaxID=2138241 RepID=A0AAF3FMB8_9BILA